MPSERNPLSDALERFGDNMLKVAMFQQQMGLDRERVGLERERVGLDTKRVGIEEERLAEQKQTSAMGRLLSIVPFIKPGSSMAENKFLHQMVADAMPGIDPTDVTGFGGLKFVPETVQNIMMPMFENYIEGLSPDGKAEVTERYSHFQLFGQPATGRDLQLQGMTTKFKLDALEEFTANPDTLRDLARTTLQLEPTRTVAFPDGTTRSYDTGLEANLAVELYKWMHDFELRELSDEAKTDIAGEFMEQVEKALGVGLPRAHAARIISAVHSKNPKEEVQKLIDSPGFKDNPNLMASLDFYLNAGEILDGTARFLQQNDPEFYNFYRMGKAISDIAGQEFTASSWEENTERWSRLGIRVPEPATGLSGIGRQSGWRQIPRPQSRGVTPGARPQGEEGAIASPQSNVQTQYSPGARDRVQAESALRQQMAADAASFRAGGLTFEQLKAKIDPTTGRPYTAEQIQVVLRQAAALQPGPRRQQ